MAQTPSQSFENHARVIPAFHMAVFGILALNLVWSVYRLIRMPGMESLIALLLAIAFVLMAFYTRVFPLTVQDRVIRLEMQLRLKGLLPPELQSRIPEFSHRQLVALRFASDQELPELCRTVLNDNITDTKTIKKMIKSWRPDHLRA
jgi:hypothetical protein